MKKFAFSWESEHPEALKLANRGYSVSSPGEEKMEVLEYKRWRRRLRLLTYVFHYIVPTLYVILILLR